MKAKLLLTTVLIVAFAAFSNAQKFQIGPKLGANIGKIDGKSFQDEFSLGYHLGGFVYIPVGKKWGIQPEVLWNQITTDTTSEFNDIYQNVLKQDISNLKLNYLSIPILLSYSPAKVITFQAGPQFGILMDKDKTLLQNGGQAFKNGDFSMVGGVQLNILSLKIYGRYVIGLQNINDIDNRDKWKTQGAQLGLGIKL